MAAPIRSLSTLLISMSLHAQSAAPAAPPASDAPLPDIPTLMRRVEINERAAEAVQKDYIFREDSTIDELNGSGAVKKVQERAFEVFWIDGVELHRLVRKDNKDLSPDEIARENARIDQEVAKARQRRAKADAEGKETDSNGREEITLSRILELGSFSNPRRETIDGRSTIAVDYTGDPKAKTRNRGEAIIRDIAGTVWVDEKTQAIQHVEGHFVNDFKVAGGLVADVHAGFAFQATNIRIHDEVWLPSTIDAKGFFRYLVFFSIDGEAHFHFGDYRKFKAKSTILPDIAPVPPGAHEPSL